MYKYKLDNQCGCIDPLALNYSSVATYDDGSCCYIAGCTDILLLTTTLMHVMMMEVVFKQFLAV